MLLNNRYLVNTLKVVFKSFTFYILLIPFVSADDYHYNNMLIGDRASGLAGAYSAIADDPSGLYYNPAGIVYATTSNISANMNAFNISQTKYKKVLGGQDWVRTSSALVPNFFGITQPLGSGSLGFSYTVTDSTLEDQDQTFNDIPSAGTKFTINFNNQDTTNNVGPSYAKKITDNFSVGLTLYGYYRTQEQIFSQSFDFPASEDDKYHWENIYTSLTEIGVKPIFGMMYTPVEKISLGLTLTQTVLLHSDYKIQMSCATTYIDTAVQGALCQPSAFNRIISTNNEKRDFPFTINLGAAYFANNKLLLTSSAWIYEAINKTSSPLVNVAAGLEYYISGKLAIRMGGFTNFANTPKLTPKAINEYNEHINIIGGTMSFTHFTRASSISFGAAATLGEGDAQVIGGATTIQEVEYMGASIFISASNSF